MSELVQLIFSTTEHTDENGKVTPYRRVTKIHEEAELAWQDPRPLPEQETDQEIHTLPRALGERIIRFATLHLDEPDYPIYRKNCHFFAAKVGNTAPRDGFLHAHDITMDAHPANLPLQAGEHGVVGVNTGNMETDGPQHSVIGLGETDRCIQVDRPGGELCLGTYDEIIAHVREQPYFNADRAEWYAEER